MIFISDHVFINKDNILYTTGSLNDEIIERYNKMVGKITIIGYQKKYTASVCKYIKEGNVASKADFKLFVKSNNPCKIKKLFDKEIKPIINKNNPVIIRMSILGVVTAKYCRKNKIPYLIEVVASTWDSLWYHSFKGKLLAPAITFVTKKEIKKAINVLYVTNNFLQKNYPSSGNMIGCSDVELNNSNYNIAYRIEHNKKIDLKELKLCTVANIEVKYKGQDLVLRAIKDLKSKGYNLKYYLVGAGNKQRLYNLAKKEGLLDNIIFVGPLPHSEILPYLSNMDIYIQPSYQEGLPRAVIEAMSVGLPCLGSTAGGTYELINDNCVFKKGKYKEITKIIIDLDKDKLNKYSIENYNRALLYDKNIIDSKRTEFYRKCLLGE